MMSEILKKLRKEKKLTQAELGQILNVSQTVYGKYENGHLEPNIQTLITLADFYNVSVDYLIGRYTRATTDNIKIRKCG